MLEPMKNDTLTKLELIFNTLKDFVETNAQLLYELRGALRQGEQSTQDFDTFRTAVRTLEKDLADLKVEGETDWIIRWANEFIVNATQRKNTSIITQPPIDYLKKEEISAGQLDWIIQRLNEQWVRFNQRFWKHWFEVALRQNA